MIYAIIIGRGGSRAFPHKNIIDVMGKPIMTYPIIAAIKSKHVEKIFISTDSEAIQKIGEDHGAIYIKRPSELCTDKALGDDAFRPGYYWIKENIQNLYPLLFLPLYDSDHHEKTCTLP